MCIVLRATVAYDVLGCIEDRCQDEAGGVVPGEEVMKVIVAVLLAPVILLVIGLITDIFFPGTGLTMMATVLIVSIIMGLKWFIILKFPPRPYEESCPEHQIVVNTQQ